jgi:ABC-type uncharacterized transport system substrate-binding protein
MKRRDFINVFVGVAAWPLAARSQPKVPVVGVLGPGSLETNAFRVAPFRRGLDEIGYVEGQNLMIEYRWAEGKFDQLPALATDLVRRHVDVIVAFANVSSLAAKAATTIIPIVFTTGSDPVQLGLVDSLNRPGGNATGITFFTTSLELKKLELLRKLIPAATVIGLLVNPDGPNEKLTVTDVLAAANTVGQRVEVVNATSERDFEPAIATAVRLGASALFVGADPLFTDAREQLVPMIARYTIPAVYSYREFCEVGGLMSYGISFAEVYHQAGIYTGKILKGVNPAELPVVRTTKFEFVINLKTAKALGIKISDDLLSLADEVIE